MWEQSRNACSAPATKGGNWRAISILGVVGWSVAVPTLIGVALGAWIDHRWPSRLSWAVTLLIAGLARGA